MKSSHIAKMVVIMIVVLLASSCTQRGELPEKSVRDAMKDDQQTLQIYSNLAIKDAENQGYDIKKIKYNRVTVIYKDGKPIGAYKIDLDTTSIKNRQKDVTLVYYYSQNKELLARVALGEEDLQFKKFSIRSPNLSVP
ncbi:hypothetical protein [Aneurinibacillus aneurinilyticus]|uniref:hypothetical protein n=1 Tax=Aneurinibacillus aneurinilyticus TaxID=1391 RepID=UPI0023F16E68|nr:hypothetical protein [Aneurinibacillus aneurinilyticus]